MCIRDSPWAATLKMAVNISARQLDDDDLAMHITTALFRSGLPACALQLEVTETAVITDLHMATQRLAELRRLGVAVAIDDFGTGQSSLTYLHRLHADVIKIDRSFVQALDVDRHAKAVAEGVIRLADSLGATTVAEGIENPAAAQTLKELGCSVGQGYLFGLSLIHI